VDLCPGALTPCKSAVGNENENGNGNENENVDVDVNVNMKCERKSDFGVARP
jgi:hypothetical protein